MKRAATITLSALLSVAGLARAATATQTFPGDNGRIVFVRGRDLWVMNGRGHNEVRLTNTNSRETLPTVSPDGTRIAFTRMRGDSRGAIFTMRMAGTGLKRLTGFRNLNIWPRFSPDGRKILYTWSSGEDVAQVRVMGRGGGNKKRLTGRSYNGDPMWSPSGNRIVYWNVLGRRPGLYVMRANGSHKERILTDALSSVDAWAPRGRIMYTTTDGHVGTIKADGSGERLLTDGPAWDDSPSYSPDGTRIAFQRCARSDCGVLVMKPDGSTRRISGASEPSDGLTWSPDGRSVVVPFFRAGVERWDLRLLMTDGSSDWLTDDGGVRESAAWQAR